MPDTFRRVAMECLHFTVVIFVVNTAHVVVMHIALGPFLARASTLREAQIFSMEMIVTGSFGKVIDDIQTSGYVVSGLLSQAVTIIRPVVPHNGFPVARDATCVGIESASRRRVCTVPA